MEDTSEATEELRKALDATYFAYKDALGELESDIAKATTKHRRNQEQLEIEELNKKLDY